MRILFFTHYTSLYGANRSLINLIEGLVQKGVIVFLIVPNEQGELIDWLKENKITYKCIPFELGTQAVPKENGIIARLRTYQYVKRQAIKRLLINIKACRQLLPLLKKWNIEILYSNSSVISIGWWLHLLTNKKYVLHIRELREAHYGFKPDWGNFLFKRHLKDTTLTITVSECVKNYYQLPTASIIYNGVFFENQLNEFSKNTPIHTPFTFGILGLIHPNKGQTTVITAFAELIKQGHIATLLIAGTGDTTTLTQLITQFNLQKHVHFLGHVSNPIEFYEQVDTTIICSKYEAMGRVTVEAMLSKTPVIGLDHSGTSELIQHKKTGLLFHENELVDCMKQVLEQPSEQTQQMIENAYAFAKEQFTVEQYTSTVFSLLKKL